uniref:Uncharacterized protein n=1 Tax=Eutreptiella gymnastica TaxID=73025 RepID=A0A6T2AMI7_9EUGL
MISLPSSTERCSNSCSVTKNLDNFDCESRFRDRCHNHEHPLAFLPTSHVYNSLALPLLRILNALELLGTWMPNYVPTPSQTPCPNQLYLKPCPLSTWIPNHVSNPIHTCKLVRGPVRHADEL